MARPKRFHDRLLDLAAGGQDPLLVWDNLGQILFANRAWLPGLGLEPAELEGLTCHWGGTAAENRAQFVADAVALAPGTTELPATREVGLPTADRGVVSFQATYSYWGKAVAVTLHPLPAPGIALSPAPYTWHDALQRARAELCETQLADFLGRATVIVRARRQGTLAAGSDVPLCIVGPPGSGRRHLARCIHAQRGAPDPRQLLIPLDGALLDWESLQSLLHRHTATTAAQETPPVTLLLSDMEELPHDAQRHLAELLERQPQRYRLLAIGQRTPEQCLQQKQLVAPLAQLLETLVIRLPELAARREDIPLLAQHFLERANRAAAESDDTAIPPRTGFAPAALEQLIEYRWPENVAELARIVRAAHVGAATPMIAADDLPPEFHHALSAQRHPRRQAEPVVLDEFLGTIEREMIERALTEATGNKAEAARLLGMTRPRLYRRLEQLGLLTDEQ